MGLFDGAFGGIASGVGGIVSSIFGNKAQRDVNSANLRIAQMNNEWSAKMMDKQNQYDIDQWNREKEFALEQREYDSAKNQATRLREAGLNPSLVMGGDNAGSAASTPHGNSVGLPSPSSATMQPLPYNGFGEAVKGAFELAALLQRNKAESDWFRTQSVVAAAKAAEEVRNMKFKNKMNDLTENLQLSMMNEDFLSKIQSRINLGEQEKLYKQTQIMNDIQIANLPEKMKADIAAAVSQTEKNKFDSMSDLGKYLRTLQEKFGVRISRSDIKLIYDAYVRSNSTQHFGSWADIVGHGFSSLGYIKSRLGW